MGSLKLSVQPRRHHCPSSSFLALNHLYRIIPIKMSETEVKTDAPTAEEIKGTKRSAEDEIDAAKKQKTENGANGANGKAVEAEENGAEVEEEEDVDEEDEEALREEEEGEGEEDLDEEAEGEEGEEEEDGEGEEEEEGDDQIILRSPNLVISYYIYQIRHLIIISALKKQEEIDCDSSKKKTRQMTTIKKNFKKSLLPLKRTHPKKNRTTKKSTTLCIISCECVCLIKIEEKNTPKVTGKHMA